MDSGIEKDHKIKEAIDDTVYMVRNALWRNSHDIGLADEIVERMKIIAQELYGEEGVRDIYLREHPGEPMKGVSE